MSNEDDSIRNSNYESISNKDSTTSDEKFPDRCHIVAAFEDFHNTKDNSNTKESAGMPRKGRNRKYDDQNRTTKK